MLIIFNFKLFLLQYKPDYKNDTSFPASILLKDPDLENQHQTTVKDTFVIYQVLDYHNEST
jgi:hypothetical protein